MTDLSGRLLRFAIRRAFAAGADPLRVNTCDLDHPRALPLYVAAGFDVVGRRTRRLDPPAPG